MRYVIVIMAVTLFVLWETIYGDWIITKSVIEEVGRVWRQLGF